MGRAGSSPSTDRIGASATRSLDAEIGEVQETASDCENGKGLTMRMSVLVSVFATCLGSAALAHGPAGHGAPAGEKAYGRLGDGTSARVVIVQMKEGDGAMLFEPNRIEVRAGEQIRFQLENAGVLDHEFLLGTPEEIAEHAEMMKTMPDMKHDDANGKTLKPKAKTDLVWHFTNRGEFDFACLIPGHREAGMTGKIVVK